MKKSNENRQKLKQMLSGQLNLTNLADTWQKNGDPYCLYNPFDGLWYNLQASFDADKSFQCVGEGIKRNIPMKGMQAYRMPDATLVFF